MMTTIAGWFVAVMIWAHLIAFGCLWIGWGVKILVTMKGTEQ